MKKIISYFVNKKLIEEAVLKERKEMLDYIDGCICNSEDWEELIRLLLLKKKGLGKNTKS